MASSISVEYNKRPRTLKDFLIVDWPASCSSKILSRNSSKASLISTYAVQRASDLLMNAIKFFPFVSIKTTTPRNINIHIQPSSNRRKGKSRMGFTSDHRVRIKDILRLKSFNNSVIMEETLLPMSIGTTFFEESTCISGLWDGDFTAEESSSICNKDEDCMGGRMAIVTKRDFVLKSNEQQSPVSVFNSTFQDDEEYISIFHPNLPLKETCNEENVSKSVIHKEEENDFAVIQKAKTIFSIFKSTNQDSAGSDRLIYDFFRQEITRNENVNDMGFEAEIIGLAESWMSGECNSELNQYLEQKVVCVRDIEREMGWKMLEEKLEMVRDLGLCVFNELIDELFVSFN